jgi:hypothetical protein
MRKFLSAVAVAATGMVAGLSAFAQQLGDYTNLTTTRTLTFANSLTGNLYDQATGVVPFLIQIGIVLLVIALVFAVPMFIWRGVKGLMHGGSH